MKLTILIPAIPERLHKVKKLYKKLEDEIGDRDVEILCLCDNMKRSIGEKRNNLKSLINADHFAFLDDDDNTFIGYIDHILKAIEEEPDIITFKQKSTLNGKSFIVTFGLDNENEQTRLINHKYTDIDRKPFHVCVWKTSLVKGIKFPFIQDGEDWAWAKKALKKVKTEIHIDEVLHHYIWDKNKTRAY